MAFSAFSTPSQRWRPKAAINRESMQQNVKGKQFSLSQIGLTRSFVGQVGIFAKHHLTDFVCLQNFCSRDTSILKFGLGKGAGEWNLEKNIFFFTDCLVL